MYNISHYVLIHTSYLADNCATMRKFRRLIAAEYDAIGAGCFGHVVHNTGKTVEQQQMFKEVRECIHKIVNTMFNTELYLEQCEHHGTETVGRPVSSNSLEWQGDFKMARYCIKNKDLIYDFMVERKTSKFFPVELRRKMLKDHSMMDLIRVFDRCGSIFVTLKQFLCS